MAGVEYNGDEQWGYEEIVFSKQPYNNIFYSTSLEYPQTRALLKPY